MHILITGADGQVGQALVQTLAGRPTVTALNRTQCDITQPAQIQGILHQVQPDVLVNLAAYTAVDRAEQEPDLAMQVNATGPKVLAEAAAAQGTALIHLSTDYVFDGDHSRPYQETDPTNPLSCYGRSKLAGEEAVRHHCPAHVIIRTAWVYGAGGKGNFVKTMLRLGAERETVRVVTDQIGTPTWTGDLAQMLTQLFGVMETQGMDPSWAGTYHFTSSGVASWYDFAVAIFEEAQALDWPLAIREVVPITTAEYPTAATRPAFSVLSGRKLAHLVGAIPPHWRQGLRAMLRDYRAKMG